MILPLPPCNKNVVYKHVLNHIKRLFSPSARKERHREFHQLLKQCNSLGQEDIFFDNMTTVVMRRGDSRPIDDDCENFYYEIDDHENVL